MPITAETVQVIVDAKISRALSDLKKTDTSSKKLFDTFKRLAGPVAIGAVVAGTIRLGKEFSKAASAAEEIGSKYATIFRDISGEAEGVADSFAENFGLASSTAQKLLGDTGDLLTGLGFTQEAALGLSEQVNTLAVDLASFSNFSGGATGASEALTKALLGEAESAKALGIVINQNTQEYKDSVRFFQEVEGLTLLQAKAFTALKFATEQSQNAIGDMSRTWNSHANVVRRVEQSTLSLKEELGKSVNKGITPMLVVTDKLISSMAEWLQTSNKLNTAIEEFENGTADGEQSVAALNNELINQVSAMVALNDAVNLNIAGSDAAVEAQKKRIEQTQILIGVAARSAALEAQGAAQSEENAKQKAIDDEKTAAADKERLEDLAALNKAFENTTEGQIKATEASIKYFESFIQTDKVIAVLGDLREELARLTEDTILSAQDIFDGRTPIADEWREAELTRIAEITAAEKVASDEKIRIAQMEQAAKLSILNSTFSIATSLLDADSRANADHAKRNFAITKALASTETVINTAAAIAEASPNPFAIAAAVALGASQLVAINTQAPPSFATGGSFVANTATPFIAGEGGGAERVTVEPIGGGGGGGNDTMILNIDGEQFTGWINKQLEDRNLRVPRSSLV